MCHNHSHITTDLTGVLLLGGQLYHELRVIHPLAVLLPYGEKWTRPCGSTLLVPALTCVPWPASPQALMAVSYTPLSYMGHSDMTTTPLMQQEQKNVGGPGGTNYTAMVRSALQETESDDDLFRT